MGASTRRDATEPGNGGATRRARREVGAARRRRRVRVALGTLVATGLVVVGLGVSDTIRLGGGEPALAGRRPTPSPSLDPPPSTTEGGPKCRAFLSPDDPLRLWIAGDSLVGSLGPALGWTAADTGIVQPVYDSRISSGLGNPSFFDWPEHATEELERLDPEVVVFFIGTNDWSFPRSRPVDESGEPAWRADYATRVDEMLDLLTDGDRIVYWVGAPILRDSKMDRGVEQVNDVARARVEQHVEATYVDAYRLFADDEGDYAASLPAANGRMVRLRADDGVHLTPKGADWIAAAVWQLLDPRCRLSTQEVPDEPKKVIRTKGSAGGTGATTTSSSSSTSTSSTSSTTSTSTTTTTTVK